MSNTSTSTTDDKEMTPDERLNYLRERGIFVETAEDRRRQRIKDIMNETDVGIDGELYDDLKFVHIPQDESLPIKELSMKVPQNRNSSNAGDLLLTELRPFFSALSKKVDLDLFRDNAAKQFGSTDVPKVSEDALHKVAEQGLVEVFTLVHPAESNKYTSVNIYLDEVGMLKRLPLNKRASELASKAGFNPPPTFYGDVFLGRVKSKPTLHNIDFSKDDIVSNTEWLRNATMENLEYQAAMNKITGTTELQRSADGENGVSKEEVGYSWTQTDEEVEIIVPLHSKDGSVLTLADAKAGNLKVKFLTKKLRIQFCGEELLSLDFFASIDPDGSTWTLDSGTENVMLIVTCEKASAVSWPRISF